MTYTTVVQTPPKKLDLNPLDLKKLKIKKPSLEKILISFKDKENNRY